MRTSTERKVGSHDGIRVGDVARLQDAKIIEFRMVGISEDGIRRYAAPATVKSIWICTVREGALVVLWWASAELSSGQWFAPADLVRVDPA